jgi:uncharacterized linocin/CFP29 family protein
MVLCIPKFTEKFIPPPYNLVFNPTQYGQLATDFYTTAAVLGLDVTQKMTKGEIFSSSVYADGTFLMTAAPSSGYFDIAVGQDVKTVNEQASLKDGWGYYFRVFEALSPRVIQANALLKGTGV